MSTRPKQPVRRPSRKPVSGTPRWVAPVAVPAGVVLVVAALLFIRWYTTLEPTPPLAPGATQTVVATITSLPASDFDAVGQGSATNLIKPVSGAALVDASGKPIVFYMGAEYCPYCAAERWPMIIALSRFGTFSGLETTTSSSSDVYPNTATFTFRGATYTSAYLDFQSVETSDRTQAPLQSPTAAQQQLVSKYDSSGVIPFVDLGNRYAFTGAMFLPDKVTGMSWQAVADAIQQPDSPQAQAILGSANLITAALCKLTSGQPAAVCSSSSIQALEQKLG